MLYKSVRLGTIAIANEPIRVDGIERKGNVIPIAIPNWLSACSLVNPALTSIIGSKNAINGCIRLVASRTQVIGVADLNIGLKHDFGLVSLPLDLKNKIMPSIVLRIQATLKDIPAGYKILLGWSK